MNFTIQEAPLADALEVSFNIEEFTQNYTKEEYDRIVRENTSRILVAYVDEKPVGFNIVYDKDKDGSLYIWMAATLNNYRRYGINKALIENQTSWAKNQGFTSLTLKTWNRCREMRAYCLSRGFDVYHFEKKEKQDENRLYFVKEI